MKQETQSALDCLNDAFKRDPAAVHALICNRVPCNNALADHPTVGVGDGSVSGTTTFNVGMLGFLVGTVEAMTGERIAAEFSDPDANGKRTMLGFCLYIHPVTETAAEQPQP